MSEIEKNYARVFSSAPGRAVLQHLRSMTIERTYGAGATDYELRWGAAQSALVHQIENIVKRGCGNDK